MIRYDSQESRASCSGLFDRIISNPDLHKSKSIECVENVYLQKKEKYLFSQLNESLKITEIDILYKAANSNKTTIVDTLTLSNFGDFSGEYYEYEYQSRKPWKTLAPIQTTRVNDIVPVRALSQESTGNRIIYGNFIDKHTSPINLNYTLQINQKDSLPTSTSSVLNDRDYYVRKEYQNHTLKQNRTYQVGVVLSDRYGRQSNVILSSVLNPLVQDESGSTIYHRYKNSEDPMLLDKYPQDVYEFEIYFLEQKLTFFQM